MLLPSLLPLNILCCSRKKMSSCLMNNPDSDEEVDLEALRLAALKSRKPKYVKRVNHNNLIPIVPISVETPDFANTKIKVEKLSPPPEEKKQDETKPQDVNKENEEDKASNYSESTLHDQDILSMDDKEEEDSLERLMDQLEAEISGKVPLPTEVLSSKNSSDKKDRRKKSKKSKTDGDDEIELVQVKTGRDCETIIEIRESASPEPAKEVDVNKPLSSDPLRSPNRRSRSLFRSRTRSRSPFIRGRSFKRSRSPYWSRSPRRSRSPFRRSRSPFWLSRRSRSSSRKLRSPLRRYRSPGRKRSPFSRFSRSRSRSFDRRRSWSLSPRRRSKSPYYRDSLPPRRNFNSPPGRIRRSFSPRDGSKSPRRRSRSPRGFGRNSPFRRSKSPFRRSRSPFRRTKSLTRRSQSPFLHRSKSPISKLNSPLPKRSPPGRLTPPKHSKSPPRRSLSPNRRPKSSERTSPKLRSKSPLKYDGSRRSPRHLPPKDMGSNKSPTFRKVRSPLRAVNERNDKPRDRNRNERRHRSLSRENHKAHDRRPYKSRHPRRFSPTNRNRKSADKDGKNSKSPKGKDASEKTKEETSKPTPKDTTVPSVPVDPVLEARKKKFENLNVVDPTIDKKISLKSIKESSENVEEDEDALTINVEGNLWDESEESEDEFDSRFKSSEAKKPNPGRTVLSFRSLRENDAASRKVILNKPLVEDNREKLGKSDVGDRWPGRRNDRWRNRHYEGSRNRVDDNDTNRNRFRDNDRNNVQSNSNARSERRSDRKPIVWSSKGERRRETESRTNEVTTTQSEVKEDKSRNSAKPSGGGSAGGGGSKDKVGKLDSDLLESDDFDKLISDFERELESDICLSTKGVNSTNSSVSQGDVKKSKISLKKNSFEAETSVEPGLKKHSGTRTVRASETCLNRLDKAQEEEDLLTSLLGDNNGIEAYTSEDAKEGPEDYIEDDDFFLEDATEKNQRNKVDDEEDGQSDLRTVLSKRRNERLTKVVSLQDNMPTRLVQSAFLGLGNKKPKRHFRETQNPLEFSSADRNLKNAGAEGRRVLLLQRDRNPSMPAVKCTVPEVQPDTTIYQRYGQPVRRRKRKLRRQPDPNEDLDQEEEEEGFEMEEERQSRRFRLKRNVTLSSQVICYLLSVKNFT